MKKKQIAILGSTGSIGTQALQVIEEHPDLYEGKTILEISPQQTHLTKERNKWQKHVRLLVSIMIMIPT